MKLNYKRVILVGMAFFTISTFWQAYDSIIPLILTNHFGLPQSVSGVIMSADNVLAVFMLPLFGALSDKVNTKFGKRTPFIFFGTIAAIISFIALTFIDNIQLANIITAGVQGNPDPVRLALEITTKNPLVLIGFIATLLLALVSMATFRSPAVALMPDITIKPLRSKANAVINLTGTAGGMLVLALGIVFATSKNKYMSYTGYFVAVASLMLAGFIIFLLSVKENKWAQEMKEQSAEPEEQQLQSGGRLSKQKLLSLMLILLSVALWFIGHNSITSKYSVYATNILGFDFNATLIISQASAIISYIPIGIISSKIGRKKSILAGIFLLATAFISGYFITPDTPEFIMYPIFMTAGIGWATISVNSYPMVVGLAKEGNIGKYTGYYYTASMSAQIIAPILSGYLYDTLGMRHIFFPFGALFVALSFITMLFVRHGD